MTLGEGNACARDYLEKFKSTENFISILEQLGLQNELLLVNPKNRTPKAIGVVLLKAAKGNLVGAKEYLATFEENARQANLPVDEAGITPALLKKVGFSKHFTRNQIITALRKSEMCPYAAQRILHEVLKNEEK